MFDRLDREAQRRADLVDRLVEKFLANRRLPSCIQAPHATIN